ncbi:MAG: YegS/Rv2252/BmrU family lipid kinase [Clostridiales bacterium]|nr:YegS/Rv2252/BmrU family lipid kinase [Clostridiales bacterium]
MGLKLKIIANPSSGREMAKINIEDMLSYMVTQGKVTRADIYYTAGQGDAKTFAMNTDQEEYDYLIAVGGDGTVNEVVSGLITGGVDIPLAIYTSGTVNDFATSIGMPTTPSDFARMLMDPTFKRVDCGKIGDEYFLNVAATGLMTDISYKVPSDLKTALGPAAYWISALKDIPTMGKTIPLTIKSDGKTIDVEALMLFVSNTTSVGGFRKLMSLADISDGVLDVLVVKKIDPTDIVPLMARLAVGDHLDSSKVIYFQSDNIYLETRSNQETVLDIDGEKGPSLPVTVECIKQRLNLIIPTEEA